MRVGPAARPVRALVQMGLTFASSDVIRGAIRLVTSLAIARAIGRDGFGQWTLSVAWASMLTVLFDLGFGVLVTREAARDPRESASLAARALMVRLTLFTPVAAWCVLARPSLFGASAAAPAIAALAAAGIAYGSVAPVFRTTPRRLVAIVTMETLAAALQCAAAVMLLGRGAGPIDLLWLAAGVLAAQWTVASVVIASQGGGVAARVRASQSVDLLRRALPFAASGLVANAQGRVGPIVLGWLGGPADVAAYGVATRIESVARRISSAAFGAALPVFSSSQRRANDPATVAPRPDVKASFDRAVGVFASASAVAIVVFASPLVRLLYGASFSSAVVPLMWAGAALVPSLVNTSRKVYLNATGGERTVLAWSAVALALQAVTALLLVPHDGAAGAAIAVGVGEVAIWAPLRAADRRRASQVLPHDALLAPASASV